jgi:hypothetical protein
MFSARGCAFGAFGLHASPGAEPRVSASGHMAALLQSRLGSDTVSLNKGGFASIPDHFFSNLWGSWGNYRPSQP